MQTRNQTRTNRNPNTKFNLSVNQIVGKRGLFSVQVNTKDAAGVWHKGNRGLFMPQTAVGLIKVEEAMKPYTYIKDGEVKNGVGCSVTIFGSSRGAGETLFFNPAFSNDGMELIYINTPREAGEGTQDPALTGKDPVDELMGSGEDIPF